jgi:hypothetical protein
VATKEHQVIKSGASVPRIVVEGAVENQITRHQALSVSITIHGSPCALGTDQTTTIEWSQFTSHAYAGGWALPLDVSSLTIPPQSLISAVTYVFRLTVYDTDKAVLNTAEIVVKTRSRRRYH